MDLMCFFFEDREFKKANPELWSGTQSDRIFAASLRARPCAITPGDKPGSMRAGQSTTSALKLDTVQGWSGVVEFSSLYSAESLHKFQPKCWIVFAYTAANNGTLYKSHESSEHTASNSRQSILKIWVPQSSPVLSFSLTQSVTLSFTVLGLRGGLCMRSWRNSLQLVKKTIPCHNSCLYLWQWPSSKPVWHETKNRRPATYNWSPKIAMSTHSLKFSTVRYKMV